jgi:hypothetical protein
VVCSIISIFSQMHPPHAFSLLIPCAHPKIPFKALINYFRLPISLRVIGNTHIENDQNKFESYC